MLAAVLAIGGLETEPGFTRIDVREDRSGCDVVWDRLIGAGTGTLIDTLSSVTAPVVLGPNGAAYVGIRTGVIMARDK